MGLMQKLDQIANDHDAEAFIAQNPDAARDATLDTIDAIEQYAEHHAGGLYVLWRYVERTFDGPDLSVKMHDSWGGPDEQGRNIVVHVYSTEDDSHDVVNYYATGSEALAAFFAADDTTKEV